MSKPPTEVCLEPKAVTYYSCAPFSRLGGSEKALRATTQRSRPSAPCTVPPLDTALRESGYCIPEDRCSSPPGKTQLKKKKATRAADWEESAKGSEEMQQNGQTTGVNSTARTLGAPR